MPVMLSDMASKYSGKRSVTYCRTRSRASSFARVEGHLTPLGLPAPGRAPPLFPFFTYMEISVFQFSRLLPCPETRESFVCKGLDERPLISITIGLREGALNRSLAHRNRANGRTQPLLYPFQGDLDPGHIP